MEGWRDGGDGGWRDGRMVEGERVEGGDGGMEGWKRDGRMEGWKDGRMEKWKDNINKQIKMEKKKRNVKN